MSQAATAATLGDIRLIRTEADFDAAVREVEGYFEDEPAPGTREAERFELLGLLIADYEAKTMPLTADPVEVVKLVMEGRGYRNQDLAEVLGSRSRASEFLNRKRDLTLDQVRRLSLAWGIAADLLIGVAF